MPVDWHPQLKGEPERMRQLALAVVLACVLSGVARAGEIPTSDRTTPHGATSQVTPGEIPTGDQTGEIPSSDATAPETLLTIIVTLLTIGR
jgi:hypothetical protein